MTARPPLVSLCIPCFNGEAFLDETLASASSQDYPNRETLVVDGDSTDRRASKPLDSLESGK